jgi:hypothetical protein
MRTTYRTQTGWLWFAKRWKHNPKSHSSTQPYIVEILESHRTPVQGKHAWMRIGTETGYTTLTSTVAVRIHVAQRQPFPDTEVSEDSHTWLRMSAMGASFQFAAGIPSKYRIPSSVDGSSTRSRVGNNAFFLRKITTDTEGFLECIEMAAHDGQLAPMSAHGLVGAFFSKLSDTMKRQGEMEFAAMLKQAGHAVRCDKGYETSTPDSATPLATLMTRTLQRLNQLDTFDKREQSRGSDSAVQSAAGRDTYTSWLPERQVREQNVDT